MKKPLACCYVLLVFVAMAMMAGCQGLSTGNSTKQSADDQQGQLSANPKNLALGNVEVGSNQTQPVMIRNSGGANVVISATKASGPGFAVTGPSLPLTLSAGQSQAFSVTFTPAAAGASSGNLLISSNASDSTLNIALSGKGVAPGALSARPSSLNFGSVLLGNKQTSSETLTNTGGSSLTITQATVTGTGFTVSGLTLPLTLDSGQATSFSVAYTPHSAAHNKGSLSISTSDSQDALDIPLSGSGIAPGALAANPTSLDFGSVQVGKNRTLLDTLTNTGGSNVNITQVSPNGSGFSISGISPPLTLTPGQQYTFSIIFAPPSAGGFSGSVSVSSDATDPTLTIPLTGTGTAQGQLAVSPTTLNFGNVTVGSNEPLNARLTASGATVTVSSVNVSNSQFVVSGLSFPVVIPAGQYANFTVTFTPQAAGAASGTASFNSDASNSPTVESLSGTGVAPQHSVDLSWTASNSQDVVSYNIYRSTQSGGPYTAIGSVEAPTTAYTDNTVTSGQTYYYVTTAVDSSNQESAYSNQAKAVIP